VLEREYGPYVVAAENGYNFSVQIDLDSLPDDKGLCNTVVESAKALI
jgi:Arp2/3 complex, 34 kD subunit p34-Arc